MACLGFLLYANTLGHGFVLDDQASIEKNWLVRQGASAVPTLFKTSYRHGFTTGADELYRPIPLACFAVLWDLFPSNPRPYHLLNVLLYAAAGFLLFLTLVDLLAGKSIILPFVASLFFMAHPVHTEVVANIKSVEEILSFVFLLLALRYGIRYGRTNQYRYLIPIVLCYAVALFSKESAITFLLLIPLSVYFFVSRSWKTMAHISAALFVPAVVFVAIRNQVIVPFGEDRPHAFLDNVMYYASDLFARWATALELLLRYLAKSVYPSVLSSDYTYAQTTLSSWSHFLPWASVVVHAGVLVYAVMVFKTRRILSYGVLFYLVSISIFSNIIIVIGSPFAERFLFTPVLGVCLVAAYLLVRPRNEEPEDTDQVSLPTILVRSKAPLLVAAALLVPMCAKTIARNGDWRDSYTLYKADVAHSPRSVRLKYLYGNELRTHKAANASSREERVRYLRLSIEAYREALEIYPEYKEAIGAMGVSYYWLGDRRKAFELYDKAIRLGTTQAATFNNMGVLLSESGSDDQALLFYQRALSYDPYNFDAWKNLGNTYHALNRTDEAVHAYSRALRVEPQSAVCNYLLALELQAQGRKEEAGKYFRIAFELDPSLRDR